MMRPIDTPMDEVLFRPCVHCWHPKAIYGWSYPMSNNEEVCCRCGETRNLHGPYLPQPYPYPYHPVWNPSYICRDGTAYQVVT